jgi:hypothetical protein
LNRRGCVYNVDCCVSRVWGYRLTLYLSVGSSGIVVTISIGKLCDCGRRAASKKCVAFEGRHWPKKLACQPRS